MVPSTESWKRLALFRESINNYVGGGQLLKKKKKALLYIVQIRFSGCQSLLCLLKNTHYLPCRTFMNSFHTHLLIIGITLDIRGGKEERDMNKTHFSASEKPIIYSDMSIFCLLHWSPSSTYLFKCWCVGNHGNYIYLPWKLYCHCSSGNRTHPCTPSQMRAHDLGLANASAPQLV